MSDLTVLKIETVNAALAAMKAANADGSPKMNDAIHTIEHELQESEHSITMSDGSQLFSLRGAAAYLHRSTHTLNRMRANKTGPRPTYRSARSVWYRRDDLDAWLTDEMQRHDPALRGTA